MYATQLHSPRNTKCMAGVSTLLSRIPGKAVKRERQRFLPFEVDDQKALPHPGGLGDRFAGDRRRQVVKCQREDRQVIAVVVAVDCGGVDHLGACSRMCSQLFSSVLLLPLHLLLLPWSSMRSSMHDGFISALRAYTPSALQTLARAADPGMQVEILPAPTRLFPPSLAVVFSRSSSAPTESSECSADRQPGE
ncbi:hypothetical protein MtB9741_08580 [Mycobacterium tuberculosis]|nr:hypothetical protein XM54_15015 [Mycobacterium tuberculosis]OAK80833.1 hypothetical protein MtB9741_08580 [Mycobacterium tuberculosis]